MRLLTISLLQVVAIIAAGNNAHSAPAPASASPPPAGTPAPTGIRLSADQIRAAGITSTAATVVTDSDAPPGQPGGLMLMGQVVTSGPDTGVLLSAVTGQLELLYVQMGATVRAGDPVARIFSAELVSMQREFLHARAAAELADSRLTRDEALFQEGIIAEARLRESRASREMAHATLQEQRRLLRLTGFADRQIDSLRPESISSSLTLRATVGGVVVDQPVRVGQRIEAGATLIRLAPPGKWWLELDASREQSGAIRVGDRVRVSGCHADGRVIAVGGQLRPASQTLPVRAEIPDANACLRSNQYIEAEVLPATIAGMAGVPVGALVRNGGSDFVFVEKNGEFRPTRVTVVRREGARALVSSGIQPADRIAVSGLVALKGAWLGLGSQSNTPGAR